MFYDKAHRGSSRFQGYQVSRCSLIGDTDVAADAHEAPDIALLEEINDVFCACEASVKDEHRHLSPFQ